MCSLMDSLEDNGSDDVESPGEKLPRSDESGLMSNRRIKALGIPALLGN